MVKETKKIHPKGTVLVENILAVPVVHYNGTIAVGKKGKVTPYEAGLLTRKGHVK